MLLSPIRSPIRSPLYSPLAKGAGGTVVIYEPETDALVARFTTPPTTARKGLINDLIVSLKTAGVWAKLDALYLTAAADSQAARRNWIADQYNLVATNSPVFTADRGFAGGASAYLSTGFTPSVAAGKYTLNSGHLSLWDLTSRGVNATCQMGSRVGATSIVDISTRFTGDIAVARVNGSATGALPGATSNGFFVGSRVVSTENETYKNGALLGAVTSTSTSLSAAVIYILARDAAGAVEAASTDQIAQASIGGGLTSSEQLALYNSLQSYMQLIGAI